MRRILLEIYFSKVESGLYEVSVKRSINGMESDIEVLDEYQLTFQQICQMIEESRADCIIIKGEKSDSLLGIYCFLKEQFSYLNFQVEFQSSNVKANDQTFLNGFNLLVSGLYPSNLYHVGTKHLVSMGKPHEKYDKLLKMHQSINSSIISDGISNEDSDVYYLKKIIFKELNNDTTLGKKTYELSMKNSELEKIKVHSTNFSDRSTLENKIDIKDTYVIYFDTEDDIEEYNKFVSEVNETGNLLALECLYLIKDECMWASDSFCSLRNNIRRKLPGDNQFLSQYSCYNNSEEVGFSEPTSQCTIFNSDKLKNQLFLKVKKENNFLEHYTKIRNIIRSFVMKIDHHDLTEPIMFNSPKKTHLSKINLHQYSYINRNYLIFHFKNSIYLYSKVKQKFYIISNKIATILEIFMYTNNRLEASRIINNNFLITDAKLIVIIEGLKEQFDLMI